MRYREAELHYWEGPRYGEYQFFVARNKGSDRWYEYVAEIYPLGHGKWLFTLGSECDNIETPDLDAAMEAAERHYADSLKAQIAEMQAIVDSLAPQEDSSPCHGCGCWDGDTGGCAVPPESRPFTCTADGVDASAI